MPAPRPGTQPQAQGKPTRNRFGKFVIQSKLGAGGMGAVYKAVDESLGRVVALKTLLPGSKGDEQLRARLLSEARAAAKLQHPGIVPIYELGEVQGTLFLAMEYIEGEDLARRMKHGLTPREAVELTIDVADAIAYAHEQSVVHRDLKPSNIMIRKTGKPVVMDFGLAKDLDKSQEALSLTRSGEALGTPLYMSPEQVKGAKDQIGPPTDVYALGAILYELLSGRPPFQADTIGVLFTKVLTEPAPKLRGKDIGTPDRVAAILGICLQKKPSLRYPNARAVAEALRHVEWPKPAAPEEDLLLAEPTVRVPAAGAGRTTPPRTPPKGVPPVPPGVFEPPFVRPAPPAARQPSFLRLNARFIAGGAALLLVALGVFHFWKGGSGDQDWRAAFEGCQWDLCLTRLESLVLSGPEEGRAMCQFRRDQARVEKKAQWNPNMPGTGPEVALSHAMVLGARTETLFLHLGAQNLTPTSIDLVETHFYILFRPTGEDWQIRLAENVSEVPLPKTSLSTGYQVRFTLAFPLPAKTLDTLFVVYNNGDLYRRLQVPQNYSRAADRSFLGADWRVRGPERIEEGGPSPDPTPSVPDHAPAPAVAPVSATPPAGVVPLLVGTAIDRHGWSIKVGGTGQLPMLYQALSPGAGNQFFTVLLDIFAEGEESQSWPIASTNFRLWLDTGQTVDPVGGTFASSAAGKGKGIFAEWMQVRCGGDAEQLGVVATGGYGLFADRFVKVVPLKRQVALEVAFVVPETMRAAGCRLLPMFGTGPAEDPKSAPGSFISPRWTNVTQDCKADEVPLGDMQSIISKIATPDWEVSITGLATEELYPEMTRLGPDGVTLRVEVRFRPWAFRATTSRCPPLDLSRFALRTPKGTIYKPMGWLVGEEGRARVVEKVMIVGNDSPGDVRTVVSPGDGIVSVGRNAQGRVWILFEVHKVEGSAAAFFVVHGLKPIR